MENNDIELIKISNDNNENVKTDNNNSNTNSIFCPICNKNLTGFSNNVIQSHVNRCLDGPTLVKKKKSFNNKIQSSITSYMNISTPTQSYITSYVKVSTAVENTSNKSNSKYFDTPNKNKNKKRVTKLNSFNDILNNNNKNINNKNFIIKSKSFNEILDNSNNKNNIIENSSTIINTKNTTINSKLNFSKNKDIEYDIDDNIFIEDISLKNLSFHKNKKNLLNDSYLSGYNQILDFSISEKEKNENVFLEDKNNDKRIKIDKYNEDKKNERINIETDLFNNNNNISVSEMKVNQKELQVIGIPFMFEDIEDIENVEDLENNSTNNNNDDNDNNDVNDNNDDNDNENNNNNNIEKERFQDGKSVKLEIQHNDDNEILLNNININENENDKNENDKNENNSSSKLKEKKKRKRKEKEKKDNEPVKKIPKKRKICPNYKKVKNTSFVVDAFSYGKIENVTAYFLSHFHSDHYGGITSKFDYGPIYCSKVTSNLLSEHLKVDKQYIHALDLNKEYIIDGVKVTLIDANHCPGAVLFLFCVPIGNNQYFNALHTGDFRASIDQLMSPAIQGLKNSFLDILYLDTTYLQPEHIFPSQEIVISSVIDVLKNIIFEGKTVKEYNNMEKNRKLKNEYQGGLLRYFKTEKDESNEIISNENINFPMVTDTKSIKKRVLVLVGTYLIGKEKVFLGIAKYLKSKIYAPNKKKKILECLNDSNISMLLTSDPNESCVHVLNMSQLGIESVNNYFNKFKDKYDMVIAFRPTGWVFKPKKENKKQLSNNSKILEELNNLKLKPSYCNKNVSIWGIPYSEHSSFVELENFIRVLSSIAPIRDIQPTVNVGSFYNQSEQSKKYWYWFDSWRQNPLII